MKNNMFSRYIILALAFVVFTLVILYQLYMLQVVNGEKYYEDSQNRVFREEETEAPRGRIMDRYGVPIAVNEKGFAIYLVKTGLNKEELNNMIYRLVHILGKNEVAYCNSLKKYISINPLRFNKDTKDIIKWQQEVLGIKDNYFYTTEGLFEYMQDSMFGIDESFDQAKAYDIMRIRYEILINSWKFDLLNPILIASDAPSQCIAEIEERHHELEGVTTQAIPVRKYENADIAAHVIGYVRNITEIQYEQWKEKGYSYSDIVGQTGIELQYEFDLKGQDGQREIEVDTSGRLIKVISEDPAIPGNDLVLTLDMNLQRAAMESFEKNIKEIRRNRTGSKNNHGDANAGAAVAIDVKTGEILLMASYPGYDPSIFLSDDKQSQREIAMLFSNDNKDKPAFNRAISGQYAPGSTFKPIIAIAALEEGVITPYTIINDKGYEEIGGKMFYCLEYKMGLGAHGPLNLERALATSCNIFFHKIGVHTTIDKIDKWADYFGFGKKTGVDLPGESSGIRSNQEYKNDVIKDQWRPADTAQTAIGQLYSNFTPIQLCNYAAAIANGGRYYTPYLVNRIIDYEGNTVKKTTPEYVDIPVKKETLEAVREGMKSVAQSVDGTAEKVFHDFPVKVAGKTGTAETGYESKFSSSNALFICYAPAEDPQIAVAVVVEHGVWGSYTAPIAKDILQAYFDTNDFNHTEFGSVLNFLR